MAEWSLRDIREIIELYKSKKNQTVGLMSRLFGKAPRDVDQKVAILELIYKKISSLPKSKQFGAICAIAIMLAMVKNDAEHDCSMRAASLSVWLDLVNEYS